MNLRKVSLSTLFVVLLIVPTVLGAVPFDVYTPAGTVSLAVPEAQAQARNTSNNRLNALRVPTNRANFTNSFSATRHTYTINLREDIASVQLQPTRGNSGQSIRHRTDVRRETWQPWSNGNWSRWRTGSSANNRISVNIGQGQERRVRIAVRDARGNVRTYTVTIRRASPNVNAAFIYSDRGTLTPRFNRTVTSYTLNLRHNEAARPIEIGTVHGNAQVRARLGTNTWSSWARNFRIARPSVAQGETQRVQFQVRGAWSNVAASPTRTRIYTVNVRRTTARQDAVAMAREYLRFVPLSRQGVIEILRAEGFSNAVATYAADNINANWNTQATRAAQLYINWWPGLSRIGMVDILVHIDGFTRAQAEFAVNSIGLTAVQQPAALPLGELMELSEAYLVLEDYLADLDYEDLIEDMLADPDAIPILPSIISDEISLDDLEFPK